MDHTPMFLHSLNKKRKALSLRNTNKNVTARTRTVDLHINIFALAELKLQVLSVRNQNSKMSHPGIERGAFSLKDAPLNRSANVLPETQEKHT